MPRITVIDHNERRILLHDGTAVRVIPYDPYHSLKYVQFDGNRIIYAFGGDRRLRIEETYNDGLFNAYRIVDGVDGGEEVEQVVQISDALGLAKAVLADNARAYSAMFAKWYGKKMQSDIVDYMIVAGNANRVAAVHLDGRRVWSSNRSNDDEDEDDENKKASKGETAYIIDGRFMVDRRGAAYYLAERDDNDDAWSDDDGHGEEAEEDEEDEDNGDVNVDVEPRFSTNMNDWKYLCLVADEGSRRGREDDIVEVPGKGAASMSPVTRVVIAKIAFLLYPSHDNVFLNQLPTAMRKSVTRMIRDKEAY